jgi:hypothetical protein
VVLPELADGSRLANARSLFACFVHVVLLLGMSIGSSLAEPPAGPLPVERIAPNRNAAPIEAEKLAAEIAKTRAETTALKAIDDHTRWWTTVLTAVGSIIGAIVGGVFTFVVTNLAQRFSRLQKELEDSRSERDRLRREDDDKLSRLRMRQEQEQAQEVHNLRLFQDLGHQSHRARLAAAAVLLDRLRRLHGVKSVEPDDAGTAQLIGKVLVAVLKRQTSIVEKPASDDIDPPSGITAESEASLRKYIADELVVTLGVRFDPGHGPTDVGNLLWERVVISRNAISLTFIGPMSMRVASTFSSLTLRRQAFVAQRCKERFSTKQHSEMPFFVRLTCGTPTSSAAIFEAPIFGRRICGALIFKARIFSAAI